jgi:glutathione S-transferase
MIFPDFFSGGRSSSTSAAVVMAKDSAPSWDSLCASVQVTSTGSALAEARALQSEGRGPAHTDAPLRLFVSTRIASRNAARVPSHTVALAFGQVLASACLSPHRRPHTYLPLQPPAQDAKSEEDVRVTLFRDTAAWCPYCQKVWLLLEEKRIPFKVSKINMRSYGDKPSWFLNKVPNGLLPAIEIDGQFMTDSLPIMQVLDATFAEEGTPMMVPPPGPERDRASKLLGLERELFGAWCSLTFQPGKGLMDRNERVFMETLQRVEDALGETAGPWFLDQGHPTLVDLQYISHIERMLASLLYWKGLQLRGTGAFPNLDKWIAAFEERPAYLATKSDYYTHCMDIPPQYGPGFSIAEAEQTAATIDGRNGAWALPLALESATIEPLASLQAQGGEEAARREAAFKLISNHQDVVRFAARGAGEPGEKRFQAPLADPYAKPNQGVVEAVDVCLRHVGEALLQGTGMSAAAAADLGAVGGEGAKSLRACLAYLRDRVGVPRDMSQPAAMHFRAHLNAAMELL